MMNRKNLFIPNPGHQAYSPRGNMYNNENENEVPSWFCPVVTPKEIKTQDEDVFFGIVWTEDFRFWKKCIKINSNYKQYDDRDSPDTYKFNNEKYKSLWYLSNRIKNVLGESFKEKEVSGIRIKEIHLQKFFEIDDELCKVMSKKFDYECTIFSIKRWFGIVRQLRKEIEILISNWESEFENIKQYHVKVDNDKYEKLYDNYETYCTDQSDKRKEFHSMADSLRNLMWPAFCKKREEAYLELGAMDIDILPYQNKLAEDLQGVCIGSSHNKTLRIE